jgi:hypothetical protein
MTHWWKYLEEYFSNCHFFHHKSHTDWPVIQSGVLWWQFGYQLDHGMAPSNKRFIYNFINMCLVILELKHAYRWTDSTHLYRVTKKCQCNSTGRVLQCGGSGGILYIKHLKWNMTFGVTSNICCKRKSCTFTVTSTQTDIPLTTGT